MSDYSYIIGSLFGLALFLLILGNLGAADDIYGDDFVVVDTEKETDYPADYDFDISRIRFTPDVNEIEVLTSDGLSQTPVLNTSNMAYDDQNRLVWDGNGTEGTITYDVSGRADTVYLRFNDGGGFFDTNTVGFFIENEQGQRQELTGGTPQRIDLSGESYEDSGGGDFNNVVELEIKTNNVDSWIDVSGFEDYQPSRDALTLIADYLRYGFSALVEFPSMIAGYIAFVSALPGFLGTILRIFIGIFFLVFIIKEFWVG